MSGPDQGIGWVIAFACFFINFILAGLARSAAVLYVALIELYGASREAASTPFTIRVCLRNMSGPLIGLLGQKYGISRVTTLGGFVAGLGSILCYFAPNITYITLFWGIVHGLGFGLSTVIHMMIISQYFDKYKASALGLGYSGDCFGSFAFPVIIESLLQTYDIKGTFLILGGIVLNVVPLAMILKKPPWLKSSKKKGNFQRNILEKPEVGILSCDKNGLEVKVIPSELSGSFNESLSISDGHPRKNGIPNPAFKNSNESLCISETHLSENGTANYIFQNSNESLNISDTRPVEDDDVLSVDSNNASPFPNPSRVYRPSLSSYSSTRSCMPSIRKKTDISDLHRDCMDRHNSLPPVFEKEGQHNVRESEANRIHESDEADIPVDDGFDRVEDLISIKKRTTSSISQLAYDIVHRVRSASFASQVAQDGYIAFINREEEDSSNKDNSLEAEGQLSSCKINKQLIDALEQPKQQETLEPEEQNIHSQSLLKTFLRTNTKPIFILISMSMAVYAFLFIGIFTVIIDYATDYGISQEEGKYLIIGFSITDLIGRLSFGQVIDRKLLKMKDYAGMTMVLMGASMAVMPLNRSFIFMMVCMCACGLIQGGTAIMFPILVANYMERNEESIAMGCLNFYGGLIMLPLSSMIGYFRDNTGSYDMVFYLQGCIVVVVGFIWQLEPLILGCSSKSKMSPKNSVKSTRL